MIQLVILRGISGSSKTTVAHSLQKSLNASTTIVSQDVIHRDILNIKDTMNKRSMPLIKKIFTYGVNRYEVIIPEGILTISKYRYFLLHLETLDV